MVNIKGSLQSEYQKKSLYKSILLKKKTNKIKQTNQPTKKAKQSQKQKQNPEAWVTSQWSLACSVALRQSVLAFWLCLLTISALAHNQN